jgi:hypothetical protein
LASQIWIPCDPLASSRSVWSPWPRWTAESLHCFGVCLRDYERFDRRVSMHELRFEDASDDNQHAEPLAASPAGD